MSKMKEKSYYTNPELWRARGDGGRGPQKEGDKMFKNRWQKYRAEKNLQASVPKAVVLPKVNPKTSSIPAWEVSDLLQIDGSKYADECKAFEKQGSAQLKEYGADQLPALRRFYLEEWEDKKEVFLHPEWHKQVPKVSVDMGPDELEAMRRDKKTHMNRVFMSERWRREKYQERLEDLQEAILKAYERQSNMYENLDEELLLKALGREPEPFTDNRTREQAWWTQTKAEMETWDIEDLKIFMDMAEKPWERSRALYIILDKLVSEYRTLQFEYKTQLAQIVPDKHELISFRMLQRKTLPLESKADEFFSINKWSYRKLRARQRFDEIRPVLLQMIERRKEREAQARANREHEFWDKAQNPFKVVRVLAGQDLSFKLNDEEYLEGSCVEVRYELANGMQVAVDQIPEPDPEPVVLSYEEELQEEQKDMWNPALSFQDWSAMHLVY